ncbi:FG-GAP repeat domain-containing protein [Pseudactinotalea suaedae]
MFAPGAPASASDDNDELLFYRTDGLFRYHDPTSSGLLGSAFLGGSNYTRNWDVITALDLDGDGQDEVLFYRTDGLYAFFDIRSDGSLGSKIRGGNNYTRGWDSIVAIDLDGDRRDELLFYRADGLYAFFDVTSTGGTGTKVRGGNNYTRGWSSIAGIDLDGDNREELLFYRTDGLYAFFDVTSTGGTGTKIRGGNNYTRDWDVIVAIDLDFGQPARPVTFGDGNWRIGSSLPPGTYRTTSQVFPDYCYWERSADFSGGINANAFTTVGQIVTIEAGDAAFESDGCGTWTSRMNILGRRTTATLPGGAYLVSTDVSPGLWVNSDSSDGCYWERLSGFSGDGSEILDNDFTDNTAYVEVLPSDVGFFSEGCGTWTWLG